MKKRKLSSLTLAFLPLSFISTGFATDYSTNGGDVFDAAAWSPDATGIIAGNFIIPSGASGDRLIVNGGNPTNGTMFIGPNTAIVQAAGGQHTYTGHIDLAGTGPDGAGAFVNNGNDWANITDARLTKDATVTINGGGWRHDSHGTALNQFNLNGKTLTVQGANSWYFVNTNVFGGGVINVDIRGEFNFEASSILTADTTLNLNNTRHSSWDQGGRTMEGKISMSNGSIIEARFNDLGKNYNGSITLNSGAQYFRTSDSGGGGGSLVINGQVSGAGELVKDGGSSVDYGSTRGIVTLSNAANNYAGGTRVESGVLRVGAEGAIPSSNIKVNGGELNLNGFSQNMSSGIIKSTVSGDGSTLVMTGPGVKEVAPGANISVPVELNGGVLRTDHRSANNVLANGLSNSLLVTGDATLKPYQDPAQAPTPGLHEFHQVGPDVFADAGTAGAIYSGVQSGIPMIDSTAKPYGDNNRWIYSGELVNTTGSTIDVSFAEQYDDQIRIKIDGNPSVLLDGGWDVATQSSIVSLTPGSHTIEISSFDGVGGAGPHSGWDKGVGIALGLPGLDNANYSKVSLATMPAGLTLMAPAVDNRADRTESKNIEIDPGVKLTVDTTDMQGKVYNLTGTISGGGSLVKSGSGILAVGGVSSYTGQTLVSQGVLKILPGGSIASSSVVDVAASAAIDASAAGGLTVAAGQRLKGNGSVIGNVSVLGTVAPGNSIGTLTVAGDLALSGVSDFELDRSAAQKSDEINVTGSLTYGGTLSLTNLDGAFQVGDTFDLFDAATFSGSFSGINWPVGTVAGNWANNLNTLGSITYVPEPTSLGMGILASAFLMRRRRK